VASLPLRGLDISNGTSAAPEAPGSGNPAAPRRALYCIKLLAVVCILVLGRGAAVDSLAAGDQLSSRDLSYRGMMPVCVSSNQATSTPRSDKKRALRSGKRPTTFCVTLGGDDPDDDETSEDPADDDDASEGLNAVSESEAPVSALLLEIGCYQSETEARLRSLWSALPSSTSFQMLSPLRC
jgi:hypothetical protein